MKKMIRVFIYIIGLFIITIGINLSIVSKLGISPVSSFTLPISQTLSISLGTITTITYIIFVIIQYCLLRDKFKMKSILQIPFSIVFGIFVDITGIWLESIQLTTYFSQFVILILSILICAIGATMYIAMDIVSNAPEGLQLSICEKFGLQFSTVKIISDCVFVLIGFTIALMFLDGNTTIREGTILSALLTGKIIGFLANKFSPILTRMAFDNESEATMIY